MCFYRRADIPPSLIVLADKHHWGEADPEQVPAFLQLFEDRTYSDNSYNQVYKNLCVFSSVVTVVDPDPHSFSDPDPGGTYPVLKNNIRKKGIGPIIPYL